LPASGKSTLAAAVETALIADGRRAYLLDGDNLRHGLNGDLGFGQADRGENVRRTAHVAAILADSGCIALTSLVSPYAADRFAARALHETQGLPFLELFVSTPLEACASRDPKGLYARARRGELSGLTGVDDPYEAPADPELEIDTSSVSIDEGVTQVVRAARDRPAVAPAPRRCGRDARHTRGGAARIGRCASSSSPRRRRRRSA
jgi:bifunctional enzyme CysN/CysC